MAPWFKLLRFLEIICLLIYLVCVGSSYFAPKIIICHTLSWYTDPSLTVENVVRVISATRGEWADGVYAYGLAGELLVPLTVQNKIKKQYTSVEDQKVALAKYWLRIVFNASWPTLIGALYFLNEREALDICVKDYLDQDKGMYCTASALSKQMSLEASIFIVQWRCSTMRYSLYACR